MVDTKAVLVLTAVAAPYLLAARYIGHSSMVVKLCPVTWLKLPNRATEMKPLLRLLGGPLALDDDSSDSSSSNVHGPSGQCFNVASRSKKGRMGSITSKRDPTRGCSNRLVIGPHRPNHYLVDTIVIQEGLLVAKNLEEGLISGYYLAITIVNRPGIAALAQR